MKQRVIAHLDLDCFYCQVEHVRLGIPMSEPLATIQWSSLVAVNYAARACGVTRFDSTKDAKQKCPQIKLVHVPTFKLADATAEAEYHENPNKSTYKVSLDVYRKASRRIFGILRTAFKHCEKASVDEAFFDITDECAAFQVPSDARWVPECGVRLCEDSEERDLEGSDEMPFYAAAVLTNDVRKKILEDLGYTCSVGISVNKTLAKICSARNKPNKQTLLLPQHITEFMETLPIDKIRFLGGKLGDKVEELGVKTCGELWKLDSTVLRRKLGDEKGKWVFDVSRGICNDPVVDKSYTKSMLAAKALNPPMFRKEQMTRWLEILCNELYGRLMDDFETTGRWPRTFTFVYKCVKQPNAKSKSTAFCRRTKGFSVDNVISLAELLFNDVGPANVLPCTRVSLSCTNLEHEKSQDKTQTTVEHFFKPISKSTDKEKITVSDNSLKRKSKEDSDTGSDEKVLMFKKPFDIQNDKGSASSGVKGRTISVKKSELFDTNVSDAWGFSPSMRSINSKTPLLSASTPLTTSRNQVIQLSSSDTPLPANSNKNSNTSVDVIVINSDDDLESAVKDAKCHKCNKLLGGLSQNQIQEHYDFHLAKELSRNFK
jgi:DNA polymerase eta